MASPHRTRPTIRDVARQAQVSHQTGSRVINGEAYTAAATRARVEGAITQFGFRPSHIARSLVSRRTHTIGLVMGDVASAFFPDVVRGIEDVIGLLQACRAGSARVPRALSVIGGDDVPYANVVEPPLTTVRVPRYEFGQAAARRRLGLLAGAPAATAEPPLRLELVGRDSRCAPSQGVAHGGPSTRRRGRRA
jgi:DNA-binding LacI/PurR family transcriptional regulator